MTDRHTFGVVLAAVLTAISLATATAGVATAQVAVTNGTVFEASDEGPTVEITENLTLDSPYDYPDAHTVDLAPNATFESNGSTNVTVDAIDGQWTNLTTHNVSAGLTVDPADKQAVTIEGETVSAVAFGSVDSQSAGVEFVYNASDPVTVTITDLPADTGLNAVDAGGSQLNDTTSTADGNATFVLPAADEQAVDIRDPAAFSSDDDDDDDSSSGGGGGGVSPTDDSETITIPVTSTDGGGSSTVDVSSDDEGTISLQFTDSTEDDPDTTDDAPADETDVDDADQGTETDGSDDGGVSQTPARAEFTRLDIQTDGQTSGEVTVQQTQSAEEITTERVESLESSTDNEPAGYISIETDFDEQIQSATFEVSVPAERFDSQEAADATVYHYAEGGWTPLDTGLVDDTGEAYTFEATSDGFSTFAVGVNSVGDSDGTNATAEANSTTDASSDTSSDEAPGFGIVVAVLSILTTAVVARRERL